MKSGTSLSQLQWPCDMSNVTAPLRARGFRAALSGLILLGAMTGLTNAQTPGNQAAHDAQKSVLNVIYTGTEGTVRLNGVPLESFGKHDSGGDGPRTLSAALGEYAINGVNTFTVDARPVRQAQASSTEAILIEGGTSLEEMDRGLQHPLFRQKMAGAAAIQHSVALRNAPHHVYDNATPWQGDPNAVLEAVRGLHKAFVDRDMKSVAASLRPQYENTREADRMDSFDHMMREFEQNLKRSKVASLPARLKVERFLDGRLLRVSGEDGAAPIQAASAQVGGDGRPELLLEFGALWCYRQGAWIPVDR
jgi:hypothetical protein